MKIINEFTGEYKGSLGTYKYVVTEAATAHYVTLYRLGYESPCLKDFKIIKRRATTLESAIRVAVKWYEAECAIG